jgi:hypothetical protein
MRGNLKLRNVKCWFRYMFVSYTCIQGIFLVTWRVHGSAIHGDQCAACCKVNANFADESACLTADNISNEVVTIHRSQKVVKMLSSLHVDIFHNCFIKNTGTTVLALTAHQTPAFTGWLQQLCFLSCTRLWHSVSWVRRVSDFLCVCSSLAPVSSNFSSVRTCLLRVSLF